MSTIKIKNGDNLDKYFQTQGTGTELDPYRMVTDVSIQSGTAPLYVVPFSNIVAETTTTSLGALDDYVINVTSATSFAAGQLLTIYSVADNRVFFSTILSISTLAITLDRPLDFAFPIGAVVSVGSTDMAVDGSGTPQIFGVRNPSTADVPLEVDISRLMFSMLTGSTPTLTDLGDITNGVTRGVQIRRVDGTYQNIINFKTNNELKNITYDLEIQTAASQAQDGLTSRFTFSNLEQVVRIGAGEDLQIVIQDDLTSLDSFTVLAQGSEVVD